MRLLMTVVLTTLVLMTHVFAQDREHSCLKPGGSWQNNSDWLDALSEQECAKLGGEWRKTNRKRMLKFNEAFGAR
jgi:hypothetical protein